MFGYPTSRVRSGVLLLIAALTVPVGARPQQTPPPPIRPSTPQVFKAGTDVVPVYVTVRDPQRGFVLDMTQDEFEILDDGKPQAISQFTIAAQPLSTVFMIDGSSSMMAEFNRAIDGAQNFVSRMLPEDRGRIGSFADRVVISPRFTSNRDELLKYLADQFNLRVGTETHLWEALLEASFALGRESGRRVVIVVSDGYNFVLPPGYAQQMGGSSGGGSSGGYPQPGGRGPTNSPPTGGRNPLPIPIGPPTGTGTQPKPGTPGAVPTPAPRQPTQPPSSGSMLDMSRNGVQIGQVEDSAALNNVIVFALSMWVRQETATFEKPHRDLEALALNTGGAFYEVKQNDDMNTLLTDVVQQIRQQYVIGFIPKSFDGKKHRLDVRIKRKGLDVLARKFYVAEKSK
jgi:hypothetical protein